VLFFKVIYLQQVFYWLEKPVSGRQGAQAGVGGDELRSWCWQPLRLIVLADAILVLLCFDGRSWR